MAQVKFSKGESSRLQNADKNADTFYLTTDKQALNVYDGNKIVPVNANVIRGDGTNSIVANDLDNNTAISENVCSFGTNNKGGLKGYYWSAINIGAKKITLATAHTGGSPVTCGYAVGDVISIVNDSKFDECSKITAINNSVITVDTLPFTTVKEYEGDWTDFCIYCPAKADVGLADLGRDSFIAGNGNKGGNWCSVVAGRDNNVIGQYGVAMGRLNKVGYAAFAVGRNNKVLGQYAANVGGSENVASGSWTVSGGRKNNVSGRHGTGFGYGNTVSGESTLVSGTSNTVSSKNSFVSGEANVVDGERCVVGGNSNKITSDGKKSAAFGSFNEIYANDCFVAGTSNKIHKANSNAFGANNNVNGTFSTASGKGLKIDSNYSFNSGEKNEIYGTHSFSSGYNNKSYCSTATSFGRENCTGIKGYYFTANSDELTLYADKEHTTLATCGWSVGDVISAGIGGRYNQATSITSINGSKIIVGININLSDYSVGDQFVYCESKQDIGAAYLGEYSATIGSQNKSYGRFTTCFGRQNVAPSSYGSAFGWSNRVGFCGFAAGYNNKTNKEFVFMLGSDNEATSNLSYLVGKGLKSDQSHQFITGQYNAAGSGGVRVTGYGTSNTARKNIEVLDTSGNLKLAGSLTLDMNGQSATLNAATLKMINSISTYNLAEAEF